MMQYIVDEAKKAKMNVALAAAPGESFLQAPNSLTWLLMFFSSVYLYNRMSDEIDWHKEWNFKEMHPARMLMDDTVPAVSLVISRFRTAPHLTDPYDPASIDEPNAAGAFAFDCLGFTVEGSEALSTTGYARIFAPAAVFQVRRLSSTSLSSMCYCDCHLSLYSMSYSSCTMHTAIGNTLWLSKVLIN